MFRNWFSAAWGDLRRSPVQSFIAIGGLAIGLAAAILAGIVARNQMSYDDFVAGHENLYIAITELHGSNGDDYIPVSPHDMAAALLQHFSEIQAVARFSGQQIVLSHGAIMAKEAVYAADPNFFRLMPLPTLYGDADKTLARPDGIVIPLSIARKYFGRDDVVGAMLELDHAHLLKIGAVIADLPLNGSHLQSGIFMSNLAPFSLLARSESIGESSMGKDGNFFMDTETLVRLRPGTSLPALAAGASAYMDSFRPKADPTRRAMHFERVDDLQLSRQVNPERRARLLVLAAAAAAILLLAAVNFINLSTARAGQRRIEIAIRKVTGAERWLLVSQFLGESIFQVLLALCVAMVLVEWLLPAVNSFLTSGAAFHYFSDPGTAALLLAGAVAVGIVAGFYPAIVLSRFRPVAALKGVIRHSPAGDRVRQGLVTLQFAALILLLIAAVTVFRQNRFATTEALRADTDQILLVTMKSCDEGFRARVAGLSGVRAAICSDITALPNRMRMSTMFMPHDPRVPGLMQGHALLGLESVGFGFFELYGIKPVAGRLFRPESGDQLPPNPAADQTIHYIINQAAARQLGYASAQAAVGQMLVHVSSKRPAKPGPVKPGPVKPAKPTNGPIVGVVPDFLLTPIMGEQGKDQPIPPMVYSVGDPDFGPAAQPMVMHVKLNGRAIPETLAAIDAAWKQSGQLDPIDRTFLNEYVQQLEISVLREGQAFAGFAAVAMILACLGLFGVSLSTTGRRIKEIGVRKAMGARNREIVALLLWQFTQPVLWANLIAWPLAFWAMNRWLSGFTYHVSLPLWLFPAAGAATLLVALLTVAAQALIVARQKPVLALRYE